MPSVILKISAKKLHGSKSFISNFIFKTSIISIILMLFVLCAPQIHALGISPGKIVILYDENELFHDFTFRAVSRDEVVSNLSLTINAQGDLAQEISFEPMREDGSFVGHIMLPVGLLPGEHTQMIMFGEQVGSNSTVTGSVAVAGQLVIKVPYPEQYLTGTMGATTDSGSGDTQITVVLENLGSVEVFPDDIEVRIQDFGQTKETLHMAPEVVEALSFSKASIVYSGARKGTIVPGEYTGVVRVPYANRELLLQQPIVVGRPIVNILDMKYVPEQGIIQPVDVIGTLRWNRPIQGKLYVYYDDDQNPVLTQDVVVQQTFNQRVYLKTSEIGLANSSIRVEIVAGSAQDTMSIPLPEHKLASSQSMLWMLLLLLAVLFALAVIVFRFIKSRNTSPPQN